MSRNTTPALPVWIQDATIDDIGRRGGMSLAVYVHGYFTDVITIYVNRKLDWELCKETGTDAATWEFQVTHSSGGRESKEVADDLDAEVNFAQGVMAAVQHARLLRSQTADLEKAYQAQCEVQRLRHLEKQAAKAAAAEADLQLGDRAAAQLLTTAASTTDRRTERQIKAWDRGSSTDHPDYVFTTRMGRDSTIRYFKSGVMLSRTKAIQDLAVCSVRSALVAA